MFVLSIMKQGSENIEPSKEDEIYAHEAGYLQRVALAHEKLNCKPHSWNPTDNMTQDYLLLDANKIDENL